MKDQAHMRKSNGAATVTERVWTSEYNGLHKVRSIRSLTVAALGLATSASADCFHE